MKLNLDFGAFLASLVLVTCYHLLLAFIFAFISFGMTIRSLNPVLFMVNVPAAKRY